MKIITGKQSKPQRVLLYGVEGIGKSTLASQFPNPIFIDCEDRTSHIDTARIVPASWTEILTACQYIEQSTDYATVVIDTLDWAEAHAKKHVCEQHGKDGIEDFGYGKGYKYILEQMRELIAALHSLQYARGVHVVMIAHSKITKFEDPANGTSYDRYSLKLCDSANANVAALCKEWCDAVLFANYEVIIETGRDKVDRAKAGHTRMLYTTHTAGFDAKNSHGMPDQIPMDYKHLKPFVEAGFDKKPIVEVVPDADEKKRLQEIAISLASRIGGKAKIQSLLKEQKVSFKSMTLDECNEFVEVVRSLAMDEARGAQEGNVVNG